MAREPDDDEADRILRSLETTLAKLFASDTDGLQRLVRALDPDAVANVGWKTNTRTAAAETCAYFVRVHGSWPAIYRLTEALLIDHARNPEVADLHRHVCASAYTGPLAPSRATREQAVRKFIARHFPGYEALRRFDQRGAMIIERKRYDEGEFEEAARYFETLAHGLGEARTRTMTANRLDTYGYILEGAIDYRSCEGLFERIGLALATPDFIVLHAARFFPALQQLQRALIEYSEAGLWPPIHTDVYIEFLQRLPAPETLPVDERQRRVFAGFAETVRAFRLLEGLHIAEPALLATIDEELPRLAAYVPPRLLALLRYRRCLALIYCGDWPAVREQLEHLPEDWDPNWTGFLWYELGEFQRSHAAYDQARRHSLPESVRHAIALRSLLALVPVLPFEPDDASPPADPSLALETIRRSLEAADEARRTRRAELDVAFDDVRCYLPAAQRLFDRVTMLSLASECGQSTRRALHAAEIMESNRGISSGGDTTAPLTRTYHEFWLCGVPALDLRSDVASELVQAALRRNPLPHVLEAAHVTCTVTEWDRERLLHASAHLIRDHGLDVWCELLTQQAWLLRQSADELARQKSLTSTNDNVSAHPILVRLTGVVGFFRSLQDYLADSSLDVVGRVCVGILQQLGTTERRFVSLTEACFDLTLGAGRRLQRTPSEMGLTPRALAGVLLVFMLETNRYRALYPFWHGLSDDYRQELLTGLCDRLSSWPKEAVESVFGSDDVPLASRIERIIAAGDDPMPSSRSSFIQKVALHWSKWQEHGYARPTFNISVPLQHLSDADVEEYWSNWRVVILQSLAERSFVHVRPTARNWVEIGIYALSALALRLGDFQVWITLFERVRPWPDAYSGFGHELTPLREALERDRALLHRFTCRVLSADTGDEWRAVVQVFYLTLLSGRTVLLADVECLRALWERTKRHEFAEMQLVICLRLALERLGELQQAAREPMWSHVDTVLADVPRRLLDRRLLSYKLRRFLRELCKLVDTSDLTREWCYRADWDRLREWLDEYDCIGSAGSGQVG